MFGQPGRSPERPHLTLVAASLRPAPTPLSRRLAPCFATFIAVGLFALSPLVTPAVAAAEDPAWPDIRSEYREGQFTSALARLQRLVAQNPQDREAHYYIALINWRLEDYRAAAVAWRRVLELDPNGPFGRDAQLWLASYGDLAAIAPRPTPRAVATPFELFPATPNPRPSIPPLPVVPTAAPLKPRPTTTPPPRTPWLQAQPDKNGGRLRSRNAKPGYFKALDGTFEFVPPTGFVLLDEGVDGSERRALFGPQTALSQGGEQPPTLLIVWRDMPELVGYRQDQKVARERQLLAIEAATYGPGAKLEARFGVATMRVSQTQGNWAADTWLFFQHDRLYAITYGGDAATLPRYSAAVTKSLTTPLFYR